MAQRDRFIFDLDPDRREKLERVRIARGMRALVDVLRAMVDEYEEVAPTLPTAAPRPKLPTKTQGAEAPVPPESTNRLGSGFRGFHWQTDEKIK